MTIQLFKLEEIGKEIREQDNLATSDPIFIVYDFTEVITIQDYPYDSEIFVCDDDCEIRYYSEEEALKEIKKEIKEGSWERYATPEEALEKAFSKYYIKRVPVFKQAFFTKKSAKAYLEENKHNLTKRAYVYCHSLYRNEEMKAIRKSLMTRGG